MPGSILLPGPSVQIMDMSTATTPPHSYCNKCPVGREQKEGDHGDGPADRRDAELGGLAGSCGPIWLMVQCGFRDAELTCGHLSKVGDVGVGLLDSRRRDGGRSQATTCGSKKVNWQILQYNRNLKAGEMLHRTWMNFVYRKTAAAIKRNLESKWDKGLGGHVPIGGGGGG